MKPSMPENISRSLCYYSKDVAVANISNSPAFNRTAAAILFYTEAIY